MKNEKKAPKGAPKVTADEEVRLPADTPDWLRAHIMNRGWRPPTPEQLKAAAAARERDRADLTAAAKETPIAALEGKPTLDTKNEHGIPRSYVGVFGGGIRPEPNGKLDGELDIAYGMLSVYFQPLHTKSVPESILAGGVFGEGEVGFSYFDEPEKGGDVRVFALAAAWLARKHGDAELFERAVKAARKAYLKEPTKSAKRKPKPRRKRR
jgi:hypothetical protein